MSQIIAKKYVKALLDGRDLESCTAISEELNTISTAYGDDKFNAIVLSNEVSTESKVELIISFVDNCSDATKNLIKLLGKNKRLDIINSIGCELSKEISAMKNTYTGVIYTNNELNNDYVVSIQEQFSKKFGVELALTQNVCDYDGIKVDIEGLGLEIGFSKDRLKTQMIDHILKAV